ncbi:hypothetical protein BC832DRAFT_361201 [Gaertneriomyces semiglobifer]|nr:hypothetical protein BC832DRAFT_361201 [Gaertneriomyces semiglobifer]
MGSTLRGRLHFPRRSSNRHPMLQLHIRRPQVCQESSHDFHSRSWLGADSYVNTGWYNRIWDTVMVWVTVGIFFVTFIPSIGIAIYQACNPVAPGEPLPLNVAIVIFVEGVRVPGFS